MDQDENMFLCEKNLFLQHHGSPSHKAMPVQCKLNGRFPEKDMKEGAIKLPAKSPDFTPHDLLRGIQTQ